MTLPTHAVNHIRNKYRRSQIIAALFAILTIGACFLVAFSGIQISRLEKQRATISAGTSDSELKVENDLVQQVDSLKAELAGEQTANESLRRKVTDLESRLAVINKKRAKTPKPISSPPVAKPVPKSKPAPVPVEKPSQPKPVINETQPQTQPPKTEPVAAPKPTPQVKPVVRPVPAPEPTPSAPKPILESAPTRPAPSVPETNPVDKPQPTQPPKPQLPAAPEPVQVPAVTPQPAPDKTPAAEPAQPPPVELPKSKIILPDADAPASPAANTMPDKTSATQPAKKSLPIPTAKNPDDTSESQPLVDKPLMTEEISPEKSQAPQ